MNVHDLELGDILFYFHMGASTIPLWSIPHYAATHTSIVSHVGTHPWISHITRNGLVFSAFGLNKGFRFLAYRLNPDQQNTFATEASHLARMWCIANNDVKLIERKSRSNVASTDYSLPVASVPGTFSYFKSHTAIFRSVFFGKKAIEYVSKLEWYKVRNIIPPELSGKGGTYCSMFVISCYQAAFGVAHSAKLLPVDAQTVMPWTFYRCVIDSPSWRCLGEVS